MVKACRRELIGIDQEVMLRKLVYLFVVLLVASCAGSPRQHADDHGHDHDHGKFTKHLEDSVMLATNKGLFSVEMVIPDKKLKVGMNSADIIVHNRNDRDVTGADIVVTLWSPNPAMNHGVFNPPVVVEKGLGLYTVENIVLMGEGHWELRINIKWGSEVVTEDNVVFDFPDVKK